MNINIIPEHTADREIVISRVVDAARERLWETMVVLRWWGADDVDYPYCSGLFMRTAAAKMTVQTCTFSAVGRLMH
ncbi:MAG: hypothetical protein M0R33_05025 [Methylomonas sp.]|jgi:hypothetical protein|uniref:hypothetical protein n=1 Tax=Methylomonas sp. TaxID=418 RepID=UPI0025F17BEF|nr:hypothetical protein [Methylomonas sp.]MCK9605797.1 hypothetical protein [Methylomonas sp.]